MKETVRLKLATQMIDKAHPPRDIAECLERICKVVEAAPPTSNEEAVNCFNKHVGNPVRLTGRPIPEARNAEQVNVEEFLNAGLPQFRGVALPQVEMSIDQLSQAVADGLTPVAESNLAAAMTKFNLNELIKLFRLTSSACYEKAAQKAQHLGETWRRAQTDPSLDEETKLRELALNAARGDVLKDFAEALRR